MGYPDQFHRLVIIGEAYGDTINTSLSIIPTAFGGTSEPSTALVAAVFNAVTAWWTDGTGTGPRISVTHKMKGIKLNRIGTDGNYADAVTHEQYHDGTLPGGSYASAPPAQLATVLTLRTAVERGHASKGRMYLPPVEGFTGPLEAATGTATVINATRVATSGRNLILALHTAYAANGLGAARVGVASDIGGGTFRQVTAVSVGRVPDTMRSRRSKLLEQPVSISI